MVEQDPLLSKGTAAEPEPGVGGQCCGCCCSPLGRRIWLCVSVLLVLLYALLAWSCARWQQAWLDDVYTHSTLVETKLGRIEYYISGTAPYTLLIHGQMAGYDSVALTPGIVDPWQAAGFGIIVPSRPGYLRTPLPSMPTTTEQQADLLAALLDELGVDQVVVQGDSAGGPEAAQFAARHPHRTRSLLLTIAITGTKKEPPSSPVYGVDSGGHLPLQGQLVSAMFASSIVSWLAWQSLKDPSVALDSALETLSNYTAEEKAHEKARILANASLMDIVMRTASKGAIPFGPRWVGTINDVVNFDNLTLPLEMIKCPTLLTYAKHDSPESGVPLDMGINAKRRIPQSKLIVVEHAWHLIWVAPEWGEVERQHIAFAKDSLIAP